MFRAPRPGFFAHLVDRQVPAVDNNQN